MGLFSRRKTYRLGFFPCPYCGNPKWIYADICPHCGYSEHGI